MGNKIEVGVALRVPIEKTTLKKKVEYLRLWKISMANSIGRELLSQGLIKFKIKKEGNFNVIEARFKV
jgi:hypothetical protein